MHPIIVLKRYFLAATIGILCSSCKSSTVIIIHFIFSLTSTSIKSHLTSIHPPLHNTTRPKDRNFSYDVSPPLKQLVVPLNLSLVNDVGLKDRYFGLATNFRVSMYSVRDLPSSGVGHRHVCGHVVRKIYDMSNASYTYPFVSL